MNWFGNCVESEVAAINFNQSIVIFWWWPFHLQNDANTNGKEANLSLAPNSGCIMDSARDAWMTKRSSMSTWRKNKSLRTQKNWSIVFSKISPTNIYFSSILFQTSVKLSFASCASCFTTSNSPSSSISGSISSSSWLLVLLVKLRQIFGLDQEFWLRQLVILLHPSPVVEAPRRHTLGAQSKPAPASQGRSWSCSGSPGNVNTATKTCASINIVMLPTHSACPLFVCSLPPAKTELNAKGERSIVKFKRQ